MNVETIFHAAHRAGLTTAACRWPVTAEGGDVIDYLVPEVMGLDMRGHEDDPASVYRKLGTSECVMDIVENALRIYGCGNAHPDYDEFEIYCAAEILRRFRPNVLFTHPGFVDGERHRTGLFTEPVKESIRVTDRWLSMLFDALRDAGIENQTDFVVLSDHGHLNICRTVCPNVFFADAGLIRTKEDGELAAWDAYCASCALSGHVYLSRPDDEELKNRVYDMLQKMAGEKLYGFERVFTKEEVRERYGLDGDFSFVIETDGLHDLLRRLAPPRRARFGQHSDYRFGSIPPTAICPKKARSRRLSASARRLRRAACMEEGHILNHAPTFARILGVELFCRPRASAKTGCFESKEIIKTKNGNLCQFAEDRFSFAIKVSSVEFLTLLPERC